MSVSEAIPALGRPVAYFPQMARFLGGDISAAVFVCQFLYWRTKVGQRESYKTRDDIESETALSHRQQRRICNYLAQRGYLEIVKKGVPARNFYTWDWDKIDADFADTRTTSSDETSPLEVTKGEHQTRPNVTTTSETTAETTTERERAPLPRAAFAAEVGEAYNAITGHNEIPWPETARNIDAILGLMPEWGLRDEAAQMAAFRAVITLKHGEWGDDAKMASALTMAVLFKDPRRFNGYLNATPAYQQMVAGKRDTMDKKTCPHCKISGGRHAVSCPTLTKQEAPA